LILLVVGTLIVAIGDAVVVVIFEIGTTVCVLHAVAILGELGTLIHIVLHPIVIGVVRTGRPLHPSDDL
jgi:hypothetical protein